MWIRVTRDLSEIGEISIGHLVGQTLFGTWDEKEKGYVVNVAGQYLIKQDECESAECAFCGEKAMEDANICIDCLDTGIDRMTACCGAGVYQATITDFNPQKRVFEALCCCKCHDIKEEIA